MNALDDSEFRREMDQHEVRIERLVNRVVGRLEERLERIEKKIDKTNGRVTQIERRHIEVDARMSERERLTKETAQAAAQQTNLIFEEREWSLKKKLGVGGLAIATISVMVPIMTALLHALT